MSEQTVAATAADLDRDGPNELIALQRLHLTQGGFHASPKIEGRLTVLWSPH